MDDVLYFFSKSTTLSHIPFALHISIALAKCQYLFFKNIKEGDCVYFVHSFYAADCEENVIATAEYGADLTAAVADKNVMGCQFHPEKSGKVGLEILRAFSQMRGE